MQAQKAEYPRFNWVVKIHKRFRAGFSHAEDAAKYMFDHKLSREWTELIYAGRISVMVPPPKYKTIEIYEWIRGAGYDVEVEEL